MTHKPTSSVPASAAERSTLSCARGHVELGSAARVAAIVDTQLATGVPGHNGDATVPAVQLQFVPASEPGARNSGVQPAWPGWQNRSGISGLRGRMVTGWR